MAPSVIVNKRYVMEIMTKGRSLGSARPQHAALGVDPLGEVESAGCPLV